MKTSIRSTLIVPLPNKDASNPARNQKRTPASSATDFAAELKAFKKHMNAFKKHLNAFRKHQRDFCEASFERSEPEVFNETSQELAQKREACEKLEGKAKPAREIKVPAGVEVLPPEKAKKGAGK